MSGCSGLHTRSKNRHPSFLLDYSLSVSAEVAKSDRHFFPDSQCPAQTMSSSSLDPADVTADAAAAAAAAAD